MSKTSSLEVATMRFWPVDYSLRVTEGSESTTDDPAAPVFPNKGPLSWDTRTRTTVQRSAQARSLSCEEMKCVWPCGHHHHEDIGEPGLQISYDTLIVNAEKGCGPCMSIRESLIRRCCCMIQGSQSELDHPHAFKGVKLIYCQQSTELWDELERWECYMKLARASWSCGECELEIRLSGDNPLMLPLPVLPGTIHEVPHCLEAIALCRRWISECLSLHAECSSVETGPLPTRVLDVGDDATGTDVSLYCSKGHEAKFIALSYCWGGSKPLSTTMTNLPQRQECIPWFELPQTYKDVVMLARLLNVRYVWIDSLCVVQDSAVDWEREATKMVSIYGDAYLVVIATAANTPHESFLGQRRRHLWSNVEFPLKSLQCVSLKVREAHHQHYRKVDAGSGSVLSTRAWCFQERLMAQRRLIYRDTEFIWECRHGCRCECSSLELKSNGYNDVTPYKVKRMALPGVYQPSNPKANPNIFASTSHAYEFWRLNVKEYTRRDLTFSTDRLPAISALAEAVQAATGDEYLAGLWKQDLLHELGWMHLSGISPKPSNKYVAPTWSWACRQQGVFCPVSGLWEDVQEQAYRPPELLDCWTDKSGKSPFGAVTHGLLHLRGYFFDVEVDLKIAGADSIAFHLLTPKAVLWLYIDPFMLSCPFDGGRDAESVAAATSGRLRSHTVQNIDGVVHFHGNGSIRLLWIHPNNWLILIDSRRTLGAYERIGIANDMGEMGAPRRNKEICDLQHYGLDMQWDEVKLV